MFASVFLALLWKKKKRNAFVAHAVIFLFCKKQKTKRGNNEDQSGGFCTIFNFLKKRTNFSWEMRNQLCDLIPTVASSFFVNKNKKSLADQVRCIQKEILMRRLLKILICFNSSKVCCLCVNSSLDKSSCLLICGVGQMAKLRKSLHAVQELHIMLNIIAEILNIVKIDPLLINGTLFPSSVSRIIICQKKKSPPAVLPCTHVIG